MGACRRVGFSLVWDARLEPVAQGRMVRVLSRPDLALSRTMFPALDGQAAMGKGFAVLGAVGRGLLLLSHAHVLAM